MSSSFDREFRARRKGQRIRLSVRRKRQIDARYSWYSTAPTAWQQRQTTLGKFVTTPKACSCWMCGNERRQGTLTHQEYVAQEEDQSRRRWPHLWGDL